MWSGLTSQDWRAGRSVGVRDVSEALVAEGPDPELREELALFGQFVGSWELECIEYAPDGTSETRSGEWHFGWALGGRAVVDVWILPGVEHGISVRFYDAELGAWRSTWIGPQRRRVQAFIARETASGIELSGEDAEGRPLRWVFSEIRQTSFHWANECFEDGAWKRRQAMRCWRPPK
jgi:hypothetical protein